MTGAELVETWRAARAVRDEAASRVRKLQVQLGLAEQEHANSVERATALRDELSEAAKQAALDGVDPPTDGQKRIRDADHQVEADESRIQGFTRALEETALPNFLTATHKAHAIAVQLVALHVAAAEREAKSAGAALAQALARRASLASLGDLLAQTGSRGASRDPFQFFTGPTETHRALINTLRRHGFAERDDAFDAFTYASAAHRPAPVSVLETDPPESDASRVLELCPMVLPPLLDRLPRALNPVTIEDQKIADAYASMDAALSVIGVEFDSLGGGIEPDAPATAEAAA